MPDCILAIMLGILEFETTGAKLHQIAAASGYEPGTAHRLQLPLIRRGWAVRLDFANRWWVTERGKIAVAIEIGRRSRARAENRMGNYRRSRIRDFERAAA